MMRDRSRPVFRLNTEDALDKYEFDLSINSFGEWSGHIIDELGRKVLLNDLRVAWVRRPTLRHRLSSISDSERFAVSEMTALLNAIYTLPNVCFINDVNKSNAAKPKFQQLISATELGIKVPKTIITNRSHKAKLFFENAQGDILTKVIYTGNAEVDGVSFAVTSKKVSAGQFSKFSHLIDKSPTQLQEYVEKLFEVRVTVVGKNVFAVKIDSQANQETMVDWRIKTSLNPHEPHQLPENVYIFCQKFIELQNLHYGAIDFIVNTEGEYVFLENNPSGQYLWLEIETGLPITSALCDLFEDVARNQTKSMAMH